MSGVSAALSLLAVAGLAVLLRLNSWCRHAGLMVRPVSVRQPSIRLLRYWMLRRP
jgi:hypothetical protein